MRRPVKVRVRRSAPPSRFCGCLPGKLTKSKRELEKAERTGNADLAKLMTARIKGFEKMLKSYCRGPA